ncbi:hypothetical protein LEMLEM_LOCUS10938 [Lemmus lemmus]
MEDRANQQQAPGSPQEPLLLFHAGCPQSFGWCPASTARSQEIWASSLAELNQECRTQHRKASYRTLTPIPTLQPEHHWTDPAYRESHGQLASIVHEGQLRAAETAAPAHPPCPAPPRRTSPRPDDSCVPRQARPSPTTAGRLTWSQASRFPVPARPTLGPGAAPGATGAGPAPILAMATRHFRPEVSRAEAAVPGGSPRQSHSTRAGPKERPLEAGPAPVDWLVLWNVLYALFCGTNILVSRVRPEGQLFRCSGRLISILVFERRVGVFPSKQRRRWSGRRSEQCVPGDGRAAVWMLVGP